MLRFVLSEIEKEIHLRTWPKWYSPPVSKLYWFTTEVLQTQLGAWTRNPTKHKPSNLQHPLGNSLSILFRLFSTARDHHTSQNEARKQCNPCDRSRRKCDDHSAECKQTLCQVHWGIQPQKEAQDAICDPRVPHSSICKPPHFRLASLQKRPWRNMEGGPYAPQCRLSQYHSGWLGSGGTSNFVENLSLQTPPGSANAWTWITCENHSSGGLLSVFRCPAILRGYVD